MSPDRQDILHAMGFVQWRQRSTVQLRPLGNDGQLNSPQQSTRPGARGARSRVAARDGAAQDQKGAVSREAVRNHDAEVEAAEPAAVASRVARPQAGAVAPKAVPAGARPADQGRSQLEVGNAAPDNAASATTTTTRQTLHCRLRLVDRALVLALAEASIDARLLRDIAVAIARRLPDSDAPSPNQQNPRTRELEPFVWPPQGVAHLEPGLAPSALRALVSRHLEGAASALLVVGDELADILQAETPGAWHVPVVVIGDAVQSNGREAEAGHITPLAKQQLWRVVQSRCSTG